LICGVFPVVEEHWRRLVFEDLVPRKPRLFPIGQGCQCKMANKARFYRNLNHPPNAIIPGCDLSGTNKAKELK